MGRAEKKGIGIEQVKEGRKGLRMRMEDGREGWKEGKNEGR